MEFDKLLKLVVEKGASDLFITAGRPPTIKINGKLFAATKDALSPEQSRETVLGVMNKDQQEQFKRDHECNFAINTRGLGRFRVSAFYQRNLIGMVLRRIEVNIPKVAELGLPPIIEQLVDDEARADHLRWRNRHRKVDVARGDDRASQRKFERPHHQHRRPDRVHPSAPRLHRHAARSRAWTPTASTSR